MLKISSKILLAIICAVPYSGVAQLSHFGSDTINLKECYPSCRVNNFVEVQDFEATPLVTWENFFHIAKNTKYSDLSLVEKYADQCDQNSLNNPVDSMSWQDCMQIAYILTMSSIKSDTLSYYYRLPKLSELCMILSDSVFSGELAKAGTTTQKMYVINTYDESYAFSQPYRDYKYFAPKEKPNTLKRKMVCQFSPDSKIVQGNYFQDVGYKGIGFLLIKENLSTPLILSDSNITRKEQVFSIWGIDVSW